MAMGSPFLVTRLLTLDTMPAHQYGLPSGISWFTALPAGPIVSKPVSICDKVNSRALASAYSYGRSGWSET